MIQTIHLFRPLNQKLMELLRSLDTPDWSRRTIAREWQVRDIAAHLLDGSLRAISLYRDQHELPEEDLKDYGEIVAYLNRLNAQWVTAMRRVSPALLINWMESSHEAYVQCLEHLDPMAPAKYSVAWAGETVSPNWFHVAREYTEKWHHQQQIREAIGQQGILTPEFYPPALNTFFLALPYAYRSVSAQAGTRITIVVDTEAGGKWTLERHDSGWKFSSEDSIKPTASIQIPASLAWKLLTKGVRVETVREQLLLSGPDSLTLPALRLIAVMA